MSRTRYDTRLRAAKRRLAESEADALVLGPGATQHYLSGFRTAQSRRHLLLIVVPDGDPVFFTPEAYLEGIRRDSWIETLVTWTDEDDPSTRLEDALGTAGVGAGDRVLVNDTLWTTFAQDVRDVTGTEVGTAAAVLSGIRAVKEEPELDRIRSASAIADEVSTAVRSMDPVGMTETELAGEIEYRMRSAGAHGAAFPTIVASGPNSGEPAYVAGDREIRPNEPVILDFGAERDGYLSDQTRTVVFGTPPEDFIDAHEAVREAQQAAVEAIEPGRTGAEIDRIAREVIESAGYADGIRHLTGHGIGLDIHEPPFLVSGSYLSGADERELEPGMVTTVEPAVYTERWGIRIEDSVVVTDDGCERLNHSSRGWKPT